MDISININNSKFNFRVSALIKNGNEILLHKSKNEKMATLPGGRVKIEENSIEALKREIKEEMGLNSEFIREVAVIENFFEFKEKQKYHELLLVHEMKLTDKDAYKKAIIEAKEEEKKGKLEFIWKSIDELNEDNFKPQGLLKVVKGENCNHIINNELK